MGNVIIFLLLKFNNAVLAQESYAVSKFLEAAIVQTGVKQELEQASRYLYVKMVPEPYMPYFNAGFTIGNILVTQKVYISKSWEF